MEDTRFKVIKLFAYVVTIIHQIVSFFYFWFYVASKFVI
ncbi:hypothetical protein CoNPh17_CDS0079 [Staphylococcus phage S-CoN_Ph17]|nr:hypothetical protein CoNPh17_CDS0079 [Staphylococcus phage S-CoN_Ph17]